MLDGFLNWFFAFMTMMLGGVWKIISNFFLGIVQIFNLPAYFEQFARYKASFGFFDWVLAIITFILAYAIWGLIIFLIVLLIRKYIRFRKSLVGDEDLLEEIAELHRDVLRLTKEKEQIMSIKVAQTGISRGTIESALVGVNPINAELATENASNTDAANSSLDKEKENAPLGTLAVSGINNVVGNSKNVTLNSGIRFFRLAAVDEKYETYQPPVYETGMNLAQICDDLRNFASFRSRLFYDIKTIRLMFAGLASTKLILLQGISGTGKTSLPYIMGKYFKNDATIASVQPSWRDRTELFGYFNEFTKKFNETEVLKRIYESSYTDEINIIVLDEMNIARVEYYFAEMLSILEMPDPNEWKIELVPSTWPGDPKKLVDGQLQIPQNVWYIGTANNDDSTFAVSDKVYDRALVINLDSKGVAFDAPKTEAKDISYSFVEDLYKQAIQDHPVSDDIMYKFGKLDLYVIEKFRVAFGNRIMKQLKVFVPVYVACGGTEIEALDYILVTKIFRKFESLNLSLIRDEIKGLITYMDNLFGKGQMKECEDFLLRLQKTY